MAALDARGTTTVAEENGLARGTILTLAQRLRPDEVLDLDQAIVEIENAVSIAVDLIQAGGRGSNHHAFVDAVLRRVAEKVKGDDLDRAARELDDELAAMEEREERLKRDRITLLDTAIRVDVLRRDPTAAARRIGQIVAAEDPFDRDAWLKSLGEKWTHYYEEGEQRGINLSLEVAVAVAELALPICVGRDERGDWRSRLASALSALGAREGGTERNGTERQEEAVIAFRAALEERTRERVPLDWAVTQNNLGAALSELGERESGTERLEEAVTAYRAALGERTRERVPLDWAKSQESLDRVVALLAKRRK